MDLSRFSLIFRFNMAYFVILILGVVGLVQSDIGYRYNAPITSYDVPFGSVGGLNDRKYYHIEKQHFPTGGLVSVNPYPIISSTPSPIISSTPSFISTPSLLSGGSLFSTPATILQTPIHEHSSFTGIETLPQQQFNTHVINSHAEHDLTNTIPISDQNPNVPIVNILGTSVNKQLESSENVVLDTKSDFGSDTEQQVEVQKHLYFFSAPDEPEEVRTKIITPPPPVKKNVKILFIKAPSFNSAPISIPVLPQNQEKTLVYVLVKKPDEQTIVVPTPAPTKPTKPEVYFIKYKTQKDAHDAVTNIQNAHDAENQQSEDEGQNLDVYSRISQSSHQGGTIIGQKPTIISTPSLSTQFGGSSGIQFIHDQGGLSNIHAQGYPSLTPELHSGGTIFSSDPITKFDASLIDNDHGFGSSTTLRPLLPTAPSEFSGRINVHQLYGPPRNR